MTEIAVLRASLNAIRALVGAVFAYTVFDNFSHDNYSASGYRHLISGYLRHDNSQFFHPFMQFASDHSTVVGPLQAVAEISIAISLLVGVAVPLAALLASGLLTGLFLAETGIYWTWELPPLIFISAVSVLAAIPIVRERGLRTALLERPNAAFLPLAGRLGVAIASGSMLILIAHANAARDDITYPAGITVALLLAIGAALDARTGPRPTPR